MQIVIDRLVSTGAGEVLIAPDGHVFVRSCLTINSLWGTMDMKKEGEKYGERIVVRKVKKRAKRSKYAGMPWLQLYSLPIVKKNVSTMTDAERRNMEMNTQALRMAHAVERNPEQLATYTRLHEAHKRNPQGYKKLYPNLFGFLVATFRMQLAAQEAAQAAESTTQTTRQAAAVEPVHYANGTPSRAMHSVTADTLVVAPESDSGITLCMTRAIHSVRLPQSMQSRCSFRPFTRLPMVA